MARNDILYDGRARPGIRAAVLGVGLAALAMAGPPACPAGADAQVVGGAGDAATVDREPRTFEHAKHRSVTCGVCHAIEERHRSRRSWTAGDCAACHHGDETPIGCTACHDPLELAAPRQATARMALSVWNGPRTRDLLFDHGRHSALGCLDCHRSGMSRPPESCASCHTEHHRPAAECTRCHLAPDPVEHDLAAHLSCAGSGCHSVPTAPQPALSRSTCVLCHAEQREHRPGRSCEQCHIMPKRPTAGTGG